MKVLLLCFQFLLGLYSYFDDKGVDVSSYGWVPIATLVGYILFLTIGEFHFDL